jgi:thiamine-monophosphate kinase
LVAAERLGQEAVGWALHGGEDYELLLALPPEGAAEVAQALGAAGTTLTAVGMFREEPGLAVEERPGEPTGPLLPHGWDPFA